MASRSQDESIEIVARLRKDLAYLSAATAEGLPVRAQKSIDAELREVVTDLESLIRKLDRINHPTSIFDPNDPKVIGRFIALTLVAQPRRSLDKVEAFYGSGVYAIYYSGGYAPYGPISGKETPIYVGKAAPRDMTARTARDQGDKLSKRLGEHSKNIRAARSTLSILDFEYRALVVQSGWESAAEEYLIGLFRPVWNSETRIAYGLGKHGDDAVTRVNKRSPWDILQPGRAWAAKSKEESRPIQQIELDLKHHFSTARIFDVENDVLRALVDELIQK